MGNAAPAPFRFDLDLGRRQEHNSVLTDSALDAIVANARDEGFDAGRRAGLEDENVRAAQAIAQAAEKLAAQVAAMHAALDDSRQAMVLDAIGLAAAVGRKLAHHALAAHPTRELEALIAECLASLENVPHLVVRCHPELADAVRDIAVARIESSGFGGRLVVLGEPEMAISDMRLEWVDGGLVRDTASIGREIDARIAEYFAAHARPRITSPGGTTP